MYAHLDRDLSGAKTGRNGRHPLPERQALAERAGAWGIAPDVQVVCYDAQGMPYAARAWWLLRWLGHDAVAVLDGGLAAWRAAGGDADARARAGAARKRPTRPRRRPCRHVRRRRTAGRSSGAGRCSTRAPASAFAARSSRWTRWPATFPARCNRFFKDNLQADGRFKPAAALRAEFEALRRRAGAAGASVRIGRHRLPQPAGHGACRAARLGAVPRLMERVVRRPARPVARG